MIPGRPNMQEAPPGPVIPAPGYIAYVSLEEYPTVRRICEHGHSFREGNVGGVLWGKATEAHVRPAGPARIVIDFGGTKWILVSVEWISKQ